MCPGFRFRSLCGVWCVPLCGHRTAPGLSPVMGIPELGNPTSRHASRWDWISHLGNSHDGTSQIGTSRFGTPAVSRVPCWDDVHFSLKLFLDTQVVSVDKLFARTKTSCIRGRSLTLRPNKWQLLDNRRGCDSLLSPSMQPTARTMDPSGQESRTLLQEQRGVGCLRWVEVG